MKVEIHSHTNVNSPCSVVPPRELIAMADAAGYDAIFITDHHRVWNETDLAPLRDVAERVKVFSGIEITLPERVDVLVLGADNPLYESLKTPQEVFAQAAADGLATVIAHPFRWMDEQPDYCALADAVETRTCNHPHDKWADKALAYANANRMATVHSGDSHGVNYLNRYWLETEDEFETAQEFRRILVTEKFENRMRAPSGPMPPDEKLASMLDLSEEDIAALDYSPAPQG